MKQHKRKEGTKVYIIIKIDGRIRTKLETNNKFGKYGTAKLFKSRKEADKWILKHSYNGMSWKYEVLQYNK